MKSAQSLKMFWCVTVQTSGKVAIEAIVQYEKS